jgi:hypothetical protein
MIPLFSQSDLDSATSRQKLPLKCVQCENSFLKPKNEILAIIGGNTIKKGLFCSKDCFYKNKNTKINISCKNCGNLVLVNKARQTNNIFCSQSCSGIFNGHKFPKRKRIPRNCIVCNKNVGKKAFEKSKNVQNAFFMMRLYFLEKKK